MINKIFIILIATFIFAQYLSTSYGAGADSSSDNGSDPYVEQYKDAKRFISRAKKLEKQDKIDRAAKLYKKALAKLQKAYQSDKYNPDVLNYLGFALRKTGQFKEAEKSVADKIDVLLNTNGSKSVDYFHKKLGKIMWNKCGMSRNEVDLKKAIEDI